MDWKKLIDTAKGIVQNMGGAQNIPGVSQAEGQMHGLVAQAKQKADAAGLGQVFDQAENAAEQKIGMDIDGDGDTGVANK